MSIVIPFVFDVVYCSCGKLYALSRSNVRGKYSSVLPFPSLNFFQAFGRFIQVSRSPVFKAMLENEMEESLSGTIKIGDVSYDALRAFVSYLYTAEVCLDEDMACNLLVLAEKYQVQHLKVFCEKFLVSKLKWENSVFSYTFAHQHNAKHIIDSALTLITENMDKLTTREEFVELVEKDPRLVVEIYEAYLSKQVNTAAQKDSSMKT